MSSRSAISARMTLPLSEVARHLVIPEGIVATDWFMVEDRCREWGDSFDVWQDGLGQIVLGVDAAGRWASTVGGVTISIPRQVAKTFLMGRIVFALSTIYPGMKTLWTAHRVPTATMTFQKLAGLSKRPGAAPYMAVDRNDGVRTSNGQQQLTFRNGSAIMFGAREQGFGRGFDEVDAEVYDEAQILTERALDDMVPAANQSRHPRGALLAYMGTPPRREIDPGEVFKGRRRKALALKPKGVVVAVAGNAVYVETSADSDVGKPGGPGLYDRAQIEKANPSFPHRTPQESIDRMRENLPSEDGWRKEALGVWDDDKQGSRYIAAEDWATAETDSVPDGVRAIGVAFSWDGSRVAVAGAVRHANGVHVEAIDAFSGSTEAGTAALAEWLASRWRTLAEIHVAGPDAPTLMDALRLKNVPARVAKAISTAEYFAACSALVDGVRDHSLTHPKAPDTELLNASVAVCDRKMRGTGTWGWESTTDDGDETPLEAASVAYRAALTTRRRPGATGGGVL